MGRIGAVGVGPLKEVPVILRERSDREDLVLIRHRDPHAASRLRMTGEKLHSIRMTEKKKPRIGSGLLALLCLFPERREAFFLGTVIHAFF